MPFEYTAKTQCLSIVWPSDQSAPFLHTLSSNIPMWCISFWTQHKLLWTGWPTGWLGDWESLVEATFNYSRCKGCNWAGIKCFFEHWFIFFFGSLPWVCAYGGEEGMMATCTAALQAGPEGFIAKLRFSVLLPFKSNLHLKILEMRSHSKALQSPPQLENAKCLNPLPFQSVVTCDTLGLTFQCGLFPTLMTRCHAACGWSL